MINWLNIKKAADFNTWYNSNNPTITPNINEVAYLINHPEFRDQHLQNVRADLKAFRLRDAQEGPFASRYTKPLTNRQAAKQIVLAESYDDKFTKKDDKEMSKYSVRLQKAINKFKDKYGEGSRHPYRGEGVPVSRGHYNSSFYFI